MTTKACPFCGSSKTIASTYDGDYWRVCVKCGASTPPCNSASRALVAWNDRRPWKERVAALEGKQ